MRRVLFRSNWVSKIDLDEVRNGTSVVGPKANVRREEDRKRGREEEEEAEEVKLDIRTTRRYQPLVLFDFVGQGELVAVERLWFDLAKDLPEAWVKGGEFGT